MSDSKHTKEFLEVWAQKVIDAAAVELKIRRRRKRYTIKRGIAGQAGTYMGKIDNTGDLRRSLEANMRVRGSSGKFVSGIGVEFLMEEYGIYVDSGRGRTMRTGANKLPDLISQWLRSPKMRLRDPETGSFLEKNDKNIKSATYLILRKLRYFGIDPTYFFTEPLDIALGKMTGGLTESMMQDVEDKLTKHFKMIPNAKVEDR